jgi:hypothetical protein
MVEDDHRGSAGRVAGNLDGVLDGLRARVEQRRALVVVAGREPVQFLADAHVALVRGDHETGVGEPLDLLADRVDHRRGGIADAGDGDARAEVDELVAVDVDKQAVAALGDEHGERRGDAGGHRARAAGLQGARGRAGDLGAQARMRGGGRAHGDLQG